MTSALSVNRNTAPEAMQFGEVNAIYEELLSFAEIADL
jgi:hypothetical protein